MTEGLILASASPRRREILENAGIGFRVVTSGVEELTDSPEGPEALVLENALRKARDVAGRESADFVLGADTIVVLDGAILGKPASLEHAKSMVSQLQGRTHEVLTGLAVIAKQADEPLQAVERTTVLFAELSADELDAYLSAFDPLDKAGAYAVQGPGALVIEGIQGCYYNVVGLPLQALERLFQSIGRSLLCDPAFRRSVP